MQKFIFLFIFFFASVFICFSQAVSTFAGSGAIGSNDAAAQFASFHYPSGNCVDASGNVYVADQYNNKIRKISPAGVVTTLAGSGIAGAADGVGNSATFNWPYAICIDLSGNLFVCDRGNSKIRKVNPSGVVTTIAGSGSPGSADGVGSAASFANPSGICINSVGDLFIADFSNHKIRKVTQSGVVTSFAGSGAPGATDAVSLTATFNGPTGICVDPSDNFYVTEHFNNKVRKVTSTAVVTTFAGSGSAGATDGVGITASFNGITGICIDNSLDLYLTEQYNQKIRRIQTASTLVSTFAGSGLTGAVDALNLNASFSTPNGISTDNLGNLFVCDLYNQKIRRIGSCSAPWAPLDITGSPQVCAGSSTTLSATCTGTTSWFNVPTGGSAIATGTNFITSNTLTAGIYTFYAEALTCTTSNTRTPIVLTVDPSPTLTVNSGTICSGQTFTIVPNGASSYTYSSASPFVTPINNSTYTVTGSTNGCQSSVVCSVNVNALPNVSVNSGSICVGNSFTLNPTGASSFTFPLGGPVVSPVNTTTFPVVGTDAATGCTNSVVSTITVVVACLTVNSGSICIGNSFTMNPTGGVSYTFSSASAVVTPSANATYTVSGTNSFGCIGSATNSVSIMPLPTITVNSGTVCAGKSFTMNPNGAQTYSYSSFTSVVNPTLNSTYTITGYSSFGCSANAISTVSVLANPVVAVNSGSICAGNSFTMNPTGALSYSYSSASAIVTPIVNSNYTVTGSDQYGCIGIAVSHITVQSLPNIIVNSGSICAGQVFTMNPNGALSYTYSSGSSTVNPTANSVYIITGINGNGCVNTATSSVTVNPLPSVSISASQSLICGPQTVTFSAFGANTYSWNVFQTTQPITFIPVSTTTIIVWGNDMNGCVNSASFTIVVSNCTNLNEFENQLNLNLYPNPTNGKLFISTSDNEPLYLEISDLAGKIIVSGLLDDTEKELDLTRYDSGIYLIKFKGTKFTRIFKIIKE